MLCSANVFKRSSIPTFSQQTLLSYMFRLFVCIIDYYHDRGVPWCASKLYQRVSMQSTHPVTCGKFTNTLLVTPVLVKSKY